MSAADIKTEYVLGERQIGSEPTREQLEESQNDWLNGAAELDGICEPYGYGEGAIGKARSITVEDVNAITGYNPETAAYDKGQVSEYGNEVTYTWDGDSKIKYSGTLNDKAGSVSYSLDDKFIWYDEKAGTFSSVAKGDTTMTLPTIKSTYYSYNASELTTISAIDNKEAFETIFGEYDSDKSVYSSFYWLASPTVRAFESYVVFCMRFVRDGTLHGCYLWGSSNVAVDGSCGVRAVVTLSADIQFTEYTANG